MKKTIFSIFITMILTNTAMAEDTLCKHNALHFATSVEKVNYVKNLLDLKSFTLKEFNKQCQTAPHIAVELGNLELLELFYDYLGHLNIENEKGENLFQSAFIHKKPTVMLFLISKGENPNHVSSNGLSAKDYQDKYGNNLTAKILEEYDVMQNEKKIDEDQKKKDELLNNLYQQIDEKEKKLALLMAKSKTDESVTEINELMTEIEKLKSYIRQLESIINEQALEIEKYKKLNLKQTEILKDISSSTETENGNLTTHIPEGKEDDVKIEAPTKMEDIDLKEEELIKKNNLNLSDISNDGEVLNDSMKLFELLSKPIIKVNKK